MPRRTGGAPPRLAGFLTRGRAWSGRSGTTTARTGRRERTAREGRGPARRPGRCAAGSNRRARSAPRGRPGRWEGASAVDRDLRPRSRLRRVRGAFGAGGSALSVGAREDGRVNTSERSGPGLRERIGTSLFSHVAGPTGPENRARIHGATGPRWFGPERPIRTVHGDASMFIGGLSALLLQSLHPQAMAAVAGHSGFRGDPWGRLQRTSTFLAYTTYGTAEDAQLAVDRVRAVHERIRGTTPTGEPYHAADPHLLCWVHCAEVDSFLRAHQRFGAEPLDGAGYDGYIADAARVARALGVPDPPCDRAALAVRLASYRSELRATPQARDAARFVLREPPLP
ncbi:DUF2236 domain-containing protein, partial [Streptomyces sp. SID6041]|nr:DUF2236 domain-containing protein [Streptomyces sp. SID6041]